MKKLFLLIAVTLLTIPIILSQTCLSEGISFTTQLQIDNFQSDFPNCITIEGDVEISGDEITNLNGLNVLISVEGELDIGYTTALSNLTGLENISTLRETLRIYMNSGLSSLSGLDNLTTIGGNLRITNNTILTDLSALNNITTIPENLRVYMNDSLTNLSGMENITSVGDNLRITNNISLINISALNNLSSIGGELAVDNNDALISITGLENIDPASITELTIRNNFLLSTCEVESVCSYLAIPNGDISIHDNAPGCNNMDEVNEACNNLGISDLNKKLDFSIYPNPAGKDIFIKMTNEVVIEEISIYNQLGQKVLVINQPTESINVSKLGQGIFIVELVYEKNKLRKKLLIK